MMRNLLAFLFFLPKLYVLSNLC